MILLLKLKPSLCDTAVVVQSPGHVQFFTTPWTAVCPTSLSFIISWSLLKFMSIESVMLTTSNYLIISCPLLLLSSIFTSIRDFSNESDLQNRWLKYWHFNFSHSNEYLTLISFKSDWLDPLAVKRTLKSLLQHHSSKASVLLHSAFFIVQLFHLYNYWNNHMT